MSLVPQTEANERCWRVIHSSGPVESVYLVTAHYSQMAKEIVRQELGERYNHKTDSFAVSLFKPDPPYFLYAINKESGEMTPSDTRGPNSMCLVCLGNTP